MMLRGMDRPERSDRNLGLKISAMVFSIYYGHGLVLTAINLTQVER